MSKSTSPYSSSVQKHTGMLTKPTDSATFCLKHVWSEHADNIFVVFREYTVKAKEIILWRNMDVLLNVELFHARIGLLPFLKISQFGLLSLFRGSLVTQNVYWKRENLTKNAEVYKKFGPFPAFLLRWMGYLYVWCVHSRFQWWRTTFDCFVKVAP